MPILLPHSIYLRIPKTGSQFVRDALKNTNLMVEEIGKVHEGLKALSRFNKCKGKKAFASVRNPITWHISWWSSWHHRVRLLTNRPQITDAWLPREGSNFNVWIERILSEYPSYASHKFSEYLGRNFNGVDYVCHQENLTEELIDVLHKVGEDFNHKKINKTVNKNNAIPRFRDVAFYTKKNIVKLIDQEKRLMLKLGYSINVNKYEQYIK